MLLIGSGSGFVKALDKSGALALSVPPEGGSEGHYLRRLRGAGYEVVRMTARGLGDLSSYLTRVHGVRPPHVGKSNRRTYYFPPLIEQYAATLPPKAKGLVFWLIEGHVLSPQELAYLNRLSETNPRVRFVVEVESDRKLRWRPLSA